MVGMRVGSCLTVHSNAALIPLWTTLYSGCFRIRVGSETARKAHVVTSLSWSRDFVITAAPTFNLQEDVVLLDAQVVGGDACVLPAVDRLGHVDLQRAVFVNHVRVTVLNAGLNVFEPSWASEKRFSRCSEETLIAFSPRLRPKLVFTT